MGFITFQRLFLLCVISRLGAAVATSDGVFSKMPDPMIRRTGEQLYAQNQNRTLLQQQLLAGYKKFVPPAGGADCQIQLALYSIVEVSTQLQTLKLQGWWRHYWVDERLSWDETLWGVSALVYNIAEIWTPDDLVYELIEEEPLGNIALTVYPSGDVFYSAPRVTTVGCKMFLQKYPFDVQTCQFTVGSMSFDGGLVDILPRTIGSPDVFFEEAALYQDKTAIDLSQFRANKEFALTKVRIVSQNFYYNCCPEPYPVLVFELTVQRQTLTFVSGILIPIIAVIFVASTVFLMPAPLSGARPLFAISVMYTVSQIYLVASRKLPEVGEYTMIGRLYMSTLACSILMTVASVLVSAINLVTSEQSANSSELLAVFRHYDRSRTGTLSPDEANQALCALGLADEEREHVMALHDMDDAPDISFDEWARLGPTILGLRPTTRHSVPVAALLRWIKALSNNDKRARPPAPRQRVALLPLPVRAVPLHDNQARAAAAGEGAEAANTSGQGANTSGQGANTSGQGANTRGQGARDGARGRSSIAEEAGGRGVAGMCSVRRGSRGGAAGRERAEESGGLGVELVGEWLAELGLAPCVRERFEAEGVDAVALAHLPLGLVERLGVRKVGHQARLVAQAQEAVAGKGRSALRRRPVAVPESTPRSQGWVGGARLGGGVHDAALGASGGPEEAGWRGGPSGLSGGGGGKGGVEQSDEGGEGGGGEGGEGDKAGMSPVRRRSMEWTVEGRKAMRVKSKGKHLGAWVDCVCLVVLPLGFLVYLIAELTGGLDFKGSAVDVEKVQTVLELVDLRAEGETCFANTQAIALPGSKLCPDVEIIKV